MSGARSKKLRRMMRERFRVDVRLAWRALAGLPMRERVKLALWMLTGRKELPK